MLEVDPIALYFESKTNRDFNERMNGEISHLKQILDRKASKFSTPRFGIPGEHRVNQAGVNSDKVLNNLI